MNEIDLVENAANEQEARKLLAKAIMEYATDYYNDYAYWSSAPNRKKHIPYVFKALIMDEGAAATYMMVHEGVRSVEIST